MHAYDLAIEAGWATDDPADEGFWRNRLRQLARLRLVAQLLLQQPTMPAVPPPPPPPVAPADDDRRGRGGMLQRPRGKESPGLAHLAHLAESAADDRSADEAVRAMLPLLARMAGPRAAAAVRQARPALRDALGGVTRLARHAGPGRRLIRTLPSIVAGTGARVRHAARRRPVAAADVIRALIAEIDRILGSAPTARRAMQRVARPCARCRAASSGAASQRARRRSRQASRRARGVRAPAPSARPVQAACACRHYGA